MMIIIIIIYYCVDAIVQYTRATIDQLTQLEVTESQCNQ